MANKLASTLRQAAKETFVEIEFGAEGLPQIPANPQDQEVQLEVWPGVAGSEIVELEQTSGMSLSDEVKSLLSETGGFTLGTREVGFPQYVDNPWDFLVPNAFVICQDGVGNGWVVESDARSGDWKHVWFVCHDPPALIYQCETLDEFIEGVLDEFRLEKVQAGRLSILSGLDARCMEVMGKNERFPLATEIRTSTDSVLATFASELPDEARVVDLRSQTIGDGFDWGWIPEKIGLRRLEGELVFGLYREARRTPKRTSWFKKLLGSG